MLYLGKQHAVGHHLDASPGHGLVREPDLAPDFPSPGHAELFGDATRDRQRGDPAGLRARDASVHAPARFETYPGQLRRLARTGLSRYDDDGMSAQGFEYFILLCRNGKLAVDGDGRVGLEALIHERGRSLGPILQPGKPVVVPLPSAAQLLQLPLYFAAVVQRAPREKSPYFIRQVMTGCRYPGMRSLAVHGYPFLARLRLNPTGPGCYASTPVRQGSLRYRRKKTLMRTRLDSMLVGLVSGDGRDCSQRDK